MRNRSKLDLNDKFPEVLRMLWWKKYLIEEHFYVKGCSKLHVLGSVQAPEKPKFGLCSEEIGGTNQKNLNIQTFP